MTSNSLWSQRAAGYGCLLIILAATIYGILDLRGLGLDFANFYDAGRKAASGEFQSLYDPFALIKGEKPFGHMLYFSAPMASYFFAPLAWLPPVQAAYMFMTIGAACIFLGLALLYRRLSNGTDQAAEDRGAFFALFCFSAMLFQPFWTVFQVGGQTTPVIFLFLVLGLICYERSRFALTALLYTLIVLIKPAFIVGAVLLFFIAPWRFKIWSVICVAAATGLSFALLGWRINLEFFDLMRLQSAQLESVPYYNSHMFAWLQAVMLPTGQGAEDVTTRLVLINRVLRILVMIWIVAVIWLAFRNAMPKRAFLAMSFVLCMLASLVVSPVVWAHYLMLMFIPLAYFMAYLLDREQIPANALTVLLAFGVLVAPMQNLLIVNQVVKFLSPLSHAEIIGLTIAKSSVMLVLMVAFLGRPDFLQRVFLWASGSVRGSEPPPEP